MQADRSRRCRRSRGAVILACVSWWFAWAGPVFAHPVPFSYLDVRLGPTAVEGTLVLHVFDVAHDLDVTPIDRLLDDSFARARAVAIERLVDGRLRIGVNGTPVQATWTGLEVLADRQSLLLRFRHPLDGEAASLSIDGLLFPYDPEHKTFVNVYEGTALTQAVLDLGRRRLDYFAGTRQGAFAVVRAFVPAGVHHIMIGPDHLLFLVGLLLVGGSARRLALIVTAFTLAHSLTLSLAALGIFTPPARIIEPAIALSIVYVGADNLLSREGRDFRAWIAFAFGFIHGFGFATVLKDMGLPPGALGWSLFSFNFGVEIGQLGVVLVVATALAMVRARSRRLGDLVLVGGSVLVMLAGTAWFIQRIVYPGGW